MYPSPPSLHSSAHQHSPSGYPSSDDFARRQRHLPIDGYPPEMVPAHHQQDQREHSTTCVPSLIPPGIDPAQVDVRTFYPYQPNEVKHRKRTTRPQLKVLEDVYKYDTKPNAGLRKRLADELEMTPRGVQVWFQNRRAKEKNLARKAEAIHDGGVTIKKPIDLDSSAGSSSSPSAIPASSSPTPVPSNSTETSSGSKDATDTPPPGTSPSPSSSPGSSISVPRIDTSEASRNDDVPFLQSPPESEESASSYLLGTPTRPSAEFLAQRRPSLPILSSTPSNSTPNISGLRAPRASIHGGGNGLLAVSHGQSPPHGFDPMGRRLSVDMNIKRLSRHPYAYLARGTNDRFHGANSSHIHSLPSAVSNTDGPGQLDGIPGGLGGHGRLGLGLRHGSMPHVLQSPLNGGQRQGQPVQDFNSFGQGNNMPPPNHRPTLTQKHSMPTFHEPPREFRAAGQQQHNSSNIPLFTNPFSSSLSAGPSPAFAYESPISPLAAGMQPPASPSSASPPPISHSLVGGYGGHGMHVPCRTVQPPIPGPLPDASFSFGHPASSSPSMSSSASSSPPSDHSTVVDMRRGSNDSIAEGDDTSAASSSAYDPLSRFGSFASVDSQSSWTSYYSEAASQDAKTDGSGQLDVPEGFDPARRPSFASYTLPVLLRGLDVTDGGTPQPPPYANDAPSDHQEPAMSGNCQPSDTAATHEQAVYSPHVQHVYQDKQQVQDNGYGSPQGGSYQNGFAPQDHHMVYPSNGQDPYTGGQDVYASMDKSGVMMGHCEPSVIPHSHTSELAFALHPSGNMNASQHSYAMGYADGTGQENAHPPTAADQSAQFDPSKAAHYAHDGTYEHQGNGGYAGEQAQGPYDGQLGTHYDYSDYAGMPVYDNGAVDLGSMCIPASMAVDGINLGEYIQQYS